MASNGGPDEMAPAAVQISPSTSSVGSSSAASEKTNTSAAVTPDPRTLFENLLYLGCRRVANPLDELEMLGVVEQLDATASTSSSEPSSPKADPIRCSLAVPHSPRGTALLLDTAGRGQLAAFPLMGVRFCVRGQVERGARRAACFAFSVTTGPVQDAQHQCHVLRSDGVETTGRIIATFAAAFRGAPPPALADPNMEPEEEVFQFETLLEIREEDGKGGWAVCPQEKSTFRLRKDRQKKVSLVVRQVEGRRTLPVEKTFGLLLAAGQQLKHADMQLLDMVSGGSESSDGDAHRSSGGALLEALWQPAAPNFAATLNTETPRDTRVLMTIAADVLLLGLDEPLRLLVECRARVLHQHERFWYAPRKPVVERHYVTLQRKQMPADAGVVVATQRYSVVQVQSAAQHQRARQRLLGRLGMPTAVSVPGQAPTLLVQPADDDESDCDEPLLSGSGAVAQDCPAEVLAEWRRLLDEEWKQSRVAELIFEAGVPDVLRGEVWRRLAALRNGGSGGANVGNGGDEEGKEDETSVADTYRMLLEKDCPADAVILRDIHRTFPAHDHFKEIGGAGQESLYKLSKAYALYDEEVSYCQGLSFLAASLLLHLPSESAAFDVLVKIMYDYQLRALFLPGFDALHLRFYQLTRLMQDQLPDLAAHLQSIGVETHMFASQWFLTLFTAKFPLQMVFYIIDIFLTEGMATMLGIALALLADARRDLLQLDFECCLKYFRVALPRRYRKEADARRLLQRAVRSRPLTARLTQLEADFVEQRKRDAESQNPVDRLERETRRQRDTILRLERENDELAHELVTSKIQLKNRLDTVEDELEASLLQVERLGRAARDLTDEKKSVAGEYEKLKELYRRDVSVLDDETARTRRIVDDYKKICSELGKRCEKAERLLEEQKKAVTARVSGCERCDAAVADCLGGEPSPRRSPGSTDSASAEASSPFRVVELMERLHEREKHILNLEHQLAKTKLELVEAQCHNQDLTHHIASSAANSANSLESEGRKWLKKAVSSIKEQMSATSMRLTASNTPTEETATGGGGGAVPAAEWKPV